MSEKLHIMHDTFPIHDISKLRPSLPQELTSLMEQLTSLQDQAML
jgi:hypothetical protein